jgi:hypothetical protein
MGGTYIKNVQIGNKGEAFIESLFSDYAIVHKFEGSKDIGLDFLCEWVYEEKPKIMFGIQVKTTGSIDNFIEKGKISRLNFLEEFENSQIPSFESIPETTLNYWKSFDFPIFVFRVLLTEDKTLAFYKRYTTIVHGIDKEKTLPFYLANEGTKLKAYIPKERTWGFCRDLFFDHLKCQHYKGMLSGVNPKDIGLSGWEQDTLYKGVFDHYKDKIRETYERYEKWKKFFM